MSTPNPQPAARTIFGAELRSAEVGEGCDAHRVVVTLAFGISSKDRDAEEMELQSNNKCHFLGCYLYYINAIYICICIYMCMYINIYVCINIYICIYIYIQKWRFCLALFSRSGGSMAFKPRNVLYHDLPSQMWIAPTIQ